MNIGIDARPLIEKKSGIGIYLKNLLDEILKIDEINNYFLISDTNIYYENDNNNIYKIVFNKKCKIPSTFIYMYCWSKWLEKENIKLDSFWGTQQFMPLNLPSNCNKVITIHDLAYRICPETVDKKNLMMMRLFSKKSLSESDEIICVSNYTKKMLKKYYGFVDKKKCNVIYESGNNDTSNNFIQVDSKADIKTVLDKKYILYIGNIEPRKNLEILLNAFDLIKEKTDLELVVCGKYGWKSNDVLYRLTNTEKVHYMNYVSDYEKNILLSRCYVFVMPSKYEGFGIPVVEAMQKESVVIVADNSSLQELVDPIELKFSTYDYFDLADKIIYLNEENEVYSNLKKYCSDRGKEFSWEIAADKTRTILCDNF